MVSIIILLLFLYIYLERNKSLFINWTSVGRDLNYKNNTVIKLTFDNHIKR